MKSFIQILLLATTNWNLTLSQQKPCKTVSGPKPNSTCVFPFVFEGHTYESCKHDDDNTRWCSTKVDSNGKHQKGKNSYNCLDILQKVIFLISPDFLTVSHFGQSHIGPKHFGQSHIGQKHFGPAFWFRSQFGQLQFGLSHFGPGHFGPF